MQIYNADRALYRKKIKQRKSCEFCDKQNARKQECRNLTAEHWLVWTNKYPYMDGNLMLVPKRHIRDVEELSGAEWAEFKVILEKTRGKLGKLFKTNDFNISINIGGKAGSSIEHMHWQIIPRTGKILNASNIFSDLYVITVAPAELKKMIEKS